ncbi:hypothetical protein PYCC9005_002770 [Savitreella phatthalungensis]
MHPRKRLRRVAEPEEETSTAAGAAEQSEVQAVNITSVDDDADELSDNAEVAADASVSRKEIPAADLQQMVKNLVRLALAQEHTRTPIRRDDFAKKIVVNNHKRCFNVVFELAQKQLRHIFGVHLVALPGKDRQRHMTITQQRKQAQSQVSLGPQGSKLTSASTQTSLNGSVAQNRAYVLQSLLPTPMRDISSRVFSQLDIAFNAVLGVILILISLSDGQVLAESRLSNLLGRLEWGMDTPAGPLIDVLQKLHRQQYIERIKDTESLDGEHNLFIGPRGGLETLENSDGLVRMCQAIYDAPASDERLRRIISDTLEYAKEDATQQSQADDSRGNAHRDETQTRRRNESSAIREIRRPIAH